MSRLANGLAIVVLVFTCFFARAQNRTWDTIPFIIDHYAQRVELFKKEARVEKAIVFLGNSITESGDWKKLLKDSVAVNRGIGGDITFGVLNRLDETIALKPAKLFLLIGINDLAKEIPDEVIIENTCTIVNRIRSGSPSTKIYLQSILPVNPTMKKFPARYAKGDHIVRINEQLKKHESHFKYVYVDIYSTFLDVNQNMDSRYTIEGLHLSPTGYQHWVTVLKELNYL